MGHLVTKKLYEQASHPTLIPCKPLLPSQSEDLRPYALGPLGIDQHSVARGIGQRAIGKRHPGQRSGDVRTLTRRGIQRMEPSDLIRTLTGGTRDLQRPSFE